MTAPETRAVIEALSAEGAHPRFVGGCVRDALLGRPVTDIDIATPDPPERVIELLERAGLKAIPTGIKHGTITGIAGERHFEITTLRRDVKTYGRHADVAFTDDWEEDASRRDLTINALSCAPDGALYDPFGGRGDLEAGRIRFVGDAEKRIEEDHLRLLRYFRFYAYFGKEPPDPEALAACRKWAGALDALSGERVRDEMLKILDAPDPVAVLEHLKAVGALGQVLPEADGFDRLERLAALEGRASDGLRRLAALLRETGSCDDAARTLAARWRLSNANADRLARMVEPPLAIEPERDGGAGRRALYRLGPELYRDLVYLAWAEAMTHTDADPGFGALLEEARRWRPVELPVKGADIRALGVPAGPEVGRLLAEVEAWWLEGDFKASREEALAKLCALVGQARES
jgi:poly(A) polymerase